MKTARQNGRRKFLLTAGLGSAGVAAAVVAARKGVVTDAKEGAVDSPKGYHVSEHILKYYRTTEV